MQNASRRGGEWLEGRKEEPELELEKGRNVLGVVGP